MKAFFKNLNVMRALRHGNEEGFHFVLIIFSMFFVMFTFALPFGIGVLGYQLMATLITWLLVLTTIVNKQINEKEER